MFDISLLQSGDNILVHTKGFSPVSMAIRELTQSYFNHAGKFYWEGDNGFIIEALFSGVVKTPIKNYINIKYDLKAVRLRPEAFKDGWEHKEGMEIARIRMYNAIGRKYDWGAIAFLGIYYIWKNYWKKAKGYLPKKFNPLESRDKFFCSELVCESDYKISSKYPFLYQGKTKSDCSTITPKDIGKSGNCGFITGIDKL